ncbi:MAG: ribonuclease P protein component [Planctomycetota bacterium]|nr:ribonuclease P protein component [Planctomycetota bacterium]
MSENRQSINRLKFTKAKRLTRREDFTRVYRGNVFVADDCLVLLGAKNECGESRIGVSVSRKVGNAVTRNQWKRLVKEAFRLQQFEIPAGLDLVFRPRKGAVASFVTVKLSVLKLAKRMGKTLELLKD